MEAQNQKQIDISVLVCELQTKILNVPISWMSWYLKRQLLGMLTSRNLVGLSILTSEINPGNSRSISQRLVFYRTICKMPKKLVCKIQNSPLNPNLTSQNLLGDVLSSICRHWPSFKSFQWVELKWAFHKGQNRRSILRDFRKSCLHCINFWPNGYCNEKILYSTHKYIDWPKFS